MISISEWYVIRTSFGNEETVRELLQAEGVNVKVIYREVYNRRKGEVVSRRKKIFPGYIFAITDLDYKSFDKLISIVDIQILNTSLILNRTKKEPQR